MPQHKGAASASKRKSWAWVAQARTGRCPILFYPDGSSVDAFVVVANNYQVGIRVDLRGITGSVRVGELSDLRKLEEDASSTR